MIEFPSLNVAVGLTDGKWHIILEASPEDLRAIAKIFMESAESGSSVWLRHNAPIVLTPEQALLIVAGPQAKS